MKRLILVVFLMLGVFLGSVVIVEGEGEDCPVALEDSWRDTAVPVLNKYNSLIQDLSNDLETVAALQVIRRELEAADRPACLEAYDEAMRALNLAADSIVASLLEDGELANDLLTESRIAFDRAVALFTGNIIGDDRPLETIANITEPVNGGEINSFDVKIRGDYNPNLLGDNHIWVFVAPPGSQLFPQPINGCDPAKRDSAVYIEAFGSWEVSANFGSQALGNGNSYDIYLTIVDDDVSNEIYSLFDEWCTIGDFPGMAANDVFSMQGLVPLERVTVTRNDS
jgi:hypothetical protein